MLGAVLGTREMVESESRWSFPPESIIQFSSSVCHALISALHPSPAQSPAYAGVRLVSGVPL